MDKKESQENQSEVARLVAQIDAEYEAAQRGLEGLSEGTSQHAFITARVENMERCREALEQIVGADEATRLVVEAMKKQEDKEA